MKSKSTIRRLEMLEKRVIPKRDNYGLVIIDHEPTAKEIEHYNKIYDDFTLIIEDQLED